MELDPEPPPGPAAGAASAAAFVPRLAAMELKPEPPPPGPAAAFLPRLTAMEPEPPPPPGPPGAASAATAFVPRLTAMESKPEQPPPSAPAAAASSFVLRLTAMEPEPEPPPPSPVSGAAAAAFVPPRLTATAEPKPDPPPPPPPSPAGATAASPAGGRRPLPPSALPPPHNGFYWEPASEHEPPSATDVEQTNSPFPVLPLNAGNDRVDLRTCLICGDRATGLHYGIISCEGCKGFFKRSICNKRVYRCSRDKNCVMSRKERNRCQYCRLLKCLQMGMNRKAIREDGMPGGRNKSIGPVQISEEEIERIMSGQEFEGEANISWNNNWDSDNSFPGNGLSESNLVSTPSSRSVELNGFTALRDQYMGTPVSAPYQYLPHLLSCPAHSALLPSQPRSLDPQSHGLLISQLVSAEDLEPLGTPMLIEDGYKVTQAELFALLCRLADELLFRQIAWIKKLPFFCELSIKDYTCLLSSTWQELILLSSLTVYSKQIFGDLADVTSKYSPSDDELHRFSEEGMEVIERLIYLYRKFSQLKVSNEEYACMKAINFLNQDIRGLSNASQLEQLNKRYWYVCQDFMEFKYPHQPNRFPDLMMCLPEIRYIAGKMVNVPLEQLPLLFKAVLHSCKGSVSKE